MKISFRTVCVSVLTPDWRSFSVCVRMILKTAWERLLSSFILVAATVRDLFPSDIRDSMSWKTKPKIFPIILLQHWEHLTWRASWRCWKNLVAGHSEAGQTVYIRTQHLMLPDPQRLPAPERRHQPYLQCTKLNPSRVFRIDRTLTAEKEPEYGLSLDNRY